ncbi:MAG: DeoR/GlpR family DNA-binding transcription regulator [Siphonobacter sp.]
MLKEERLQFILTQINIHNKVLSSDLSVRLGVSEDTIRRDLSELVDNGQIIKVHGGAISKAFHYQTFDREIYRREAKKEIARKALDLIKDEMIILMGGGTTMVELARMIPEKLHCTFFTISPVVALELAENPTIDVHVIAGKLSSSTQTMTGAQTIAQLADLSVDLCFLGTNSISVEDGVTDSDWEIVQVKKAMIKSAHETAMLSIAEKLNSRQKMKVCPLHELKYLITDLPSNDPMLSAYQQKMIVL